MAAAAASRVKALFAAAAILSIGLLPGVASATLGELEDSTRADSRQLQGSIKLLDRSLYRVHEIRLPSGTVLREFAALDGRVFAVAWQGPSVPDLRQTLGRYFEPYVAAQKRKQGSRHQLQIRSPELVVSAAGHMRAFSGHAYLPQATPAGVDVGDLH